MSLVRLIRSLSTGRNVQTNTLVFVRCEKNGPRCTGHNRIKKKGSPYSTVEELVSWRWAITVGKTLIYQRTSVGKRNSARTSWPEGCGGGAL